MKIILYSIFDSGSGIPELKNKLKNGVMDCDVIKTS